jgi:chorismate dehydratase
MDTDRKISVSAVSYVNTYPFLLGLEGEQIRDAIDLTLDVPSECARKLLSAEVELGLVPVAIIPLLKEPHIVTDFCIGADGAVDTVCLFSEVPLDQITEVLLDFQSRTSVQLMRVLAQRHFHITPRWAHADEGFIGQISGSTAGVVIGDKAFALRSRFPVVIDLAEEWKKLTGLPFVFACWVSNGRLPQSFLDRFNTALAFGVAHREEAVLSRGLPDATEMVNYVNHRISYPLDHPKREAMTLFLSWAIAL